MAKETGGDVLSRPTTGVSRGVRGKSVLSTTAYRIQPAAVGSKGGRGEPVLSTAGHGCPQGDSGTLSVCVFESKKIGVAGNLSIHQCRTAQPARPRVRGAGIDNKQGSV